MGWIPAELLPPADRLCPWREADEQGSPLWACLENKRLGVCLDGETTPGLHTLGRPP